MYLRTWGLPLLSWKQDLSMTLWDFALLSLCRSLFRASAQSFECVKRSTEHFLWWWKLVRRERKSMLTMHLFKKKTNKTAALVSIMIRLTGREKNNQKNSRHTAFPCFKYSLPLSFLLSDRRLLPVLNYAAGHVWKESSLVERKKRWWGRGRQRQGR